MTRLAAAIPLSLSVFLLALAFVAAMLGAGLLSDDSVRLWAGTITASDGGASIGRIVASYPSAPFLASSLMQFLTPEGTPAPSLLATALIGLLGGVWYLELRASGLSFPVAALATLLLALHPAMLRAGLAGAAEMFLAAFLFLLGSALYDLRARAAAPEVMAVSFALLGVAFSHPLGVALALSPFLIFAVPPSVIANSAINVALVLVFPTLFCIGAFTYVSWVFPGSGWSVFAAPAESLSTWTAGTGELFGSAATVSPTLTAALATSFAIVVGAPAALFGLTLARGRQPLLTPPLVLCALAVSASMIATASGQFGNPAATSVIVPIVALLVITHVPEMRLYPVRLLALLAFGWIGGLIGTIAADPGAALAIGSAEPSLRAVARADAFHLGRATSAYDNVMADTEHTPMIVIGRGRARGLLTPSSDTFTLATLTGRVDAPFVAVPDPHSAAAAQDDVAKTFPALFRNGAPGYRLVYQNRTWRLYARNNTDGR
jgi:hypothetical protein